MSLILIGASSTLRVGALESWRSPSNRTFNPSVRLADDGRRETDAVALRVANIVGDPPGALLRTYRHGRLDGERDLSAECRALGIDRVADPKLFSMDGRMWVTFNTGSKPAGNDLYLWELDSDGAHPIRCEVDGRARIEKNWQFACRDDRLLAVYSVDPLVVIEADMPSGGERELVFRPPSAMPPAGQRGLRRRIARRSMSLGTPLLRSGPDTFRMIVHEKFHLAGKRLYLGRAAELSLRQTPTLRLGRDRLAHSWPAMLGTRPRLNPNLVSCTYFSGIAGEPDRPVLSFGLNDARAGFVRCDWSEVFRP